MDVTTFCKVFEVLTPFPDVVQRLDKWGSPYKSQKAHVVNWFASQKTTGSGAYTRQAGNNSARTCYNRLLNPGMLIWMASVLGADEEKIEQATAAAVEAEMNPRLAVLIAHVKLDGRIFLLLQLCLSH